MSKDNREELYKLLKKDPRADTYVIPQRVMDIIVEYTQKQSDIARLEELQRILDFVGEHSSTDSYIGLSDRIAELETPKQVEETE